MKQIISHSGLNANGFTHCQNRNISHLFWNPRNQVVDSISFYFKRHLKTGSSKQNEDGVRLVVIKIGTGEMFLDTQEAAKQNFVCKFR